jgi:hypothetical protein
MNPWSFSARGPLLTSQSEQDNLTGRMICCCNNLKIKHGKGQKISCPVFMMQSIALSPVKKNNGERSSK